MMHIYQPRDDRPRHSSDDQAHHGGKGRSPPKQARWGSSKGKGDFGRRSSKGKKSGGKGKTGKQKGKGFGKHFSKTKPTKPTVLPFGAWGSDDDGLPPGGQDASLSTAPKNPADVRSSAPSDRITRDEWFGAAQHVPVDLIVRPATSLLPDERVKALPVDMDEMQSTATAIQGMAERIPEGAARTAARILHASGLVQSVGILTMEILSIGRAYRCLYIPVQTHEPTPFGHKAGERTGNLWTYSFCHGTDEDAATLILRENLIRPSKDDSEHVVSVGFFGPGTQGNLTRDIATTVIQKELKLSKGLQGALIVGEFRSRYQHHSAKWASCSEEQRICASTGVVRTSERWTFCSARAHIMALAIPIAF